MNSKRFKTMLLWIAFTFVVMLAAYYVKSSQHAWTLNEERARIANILSANPIYKNLRVEIVPNFQVVIQGTVATQDDMDRLNRELDAAHMEFLVRAARIEQTR